MAIYKVGADGQAPSGLKIGDRVVTGGGTYEIVAAGTPGANYNSKNGYYSRLVDSSQTTYNYNSGSSGSSGSSGGGKVFSTSGQGNITTAQKVAQQTSPASAAWGQTSGSTIKPQSGAFNTDGSTTVSNYGQGQLVYDANTGRITRVMDNGKQFYVDSGDAKYNELYKEYVSRYGAPAGSQDYAQNIAQQALQQTQSGGNSSGGNSADGSYLLNNGTTQVQIPQYQAPDTSETEKMLSAILDKLNSQPEYKPVDQSAFLNGVMSYDQAVEIARKALEPQYQEAYQKAATNSAQNLDRAGLYNTLYGQSLAQQAQNEVDEDMAASIAAQALAMQDADKQLAMELYRTAVAENQFKNDASRAQLSAAANTALSYLDAVVSQAQISNSYALQQAGLQLDVAAQKLQEDYNKGVLQQMDYENQLSQLQLRAQELKNQLLGYDIQAAQQALQAAATPYSSGSGGSGSSGGTGGFGGDAGGGDEQPKLEASPTTKELVTNYNDLVSMINGGYYQNYDDAIYDLDNLYAMGEVPQWAYVGLKEQARRKYGTPAAQASATHDSTTPSPASLFALADGNKNTFRRLMADNGYPDAEALSWWTRLGGY